MKQVHLFLVRHGQTIFNHYNKIQGWGDSPLTKTGLQDAAIAGEAFANRKFNAIYSSDTMRASQTAEVIDNANKMNLPPVVRLEELREEFYGFFEGTDSTTYGYTIGQQYGCSSLAEINKKVGLDGVKDLTKQLDPFHEAENAKEFWDRIDRGIDKIFKASNDGDDVLVVGHGTVIKNLVDRYGKDKFNALHVPQNGSISEIVVSDDGIDVISFNMKNHLKH